MMNIQWVISESDTKELYENVNESGGKILNEAEHYKPTIDELDDYGDSFLDPLTIVTLAVSSVYVISALKNMWLDLKNPNGYVLDKTGDVLKTRPLPGRPGTLVFIDETGVHTVKASNKTEGEALLKSFIESAEITNA